MSNRKLFQKPWGQSILAALFLWLSFPPYNLGILQIPAFVLLFRLSVTSVTVRQMIYYTYPSLVLWNLLSTYWLMMATMAGGAAAIVANAALMVIPLWIIRILFRSSLPPLISSFLAAATWVSYEFLHHQWDLAWPWLTLGNAWSNLTGVIQYISVTGVWGISFWVVLTASLVWHSMQSSSAVIRRSALAVFVLFPILSVFSLATMPQTEEHPLNVTIVQPNSDSYQPFGGHDTLDDLVTHLLELSESAQTNETDLIIWPENALDALLTPESPQLSRIRDSLSVWDTQLITGSGYLKYYPEEEVPDIVRGNHSGRAFNVFNAAFQLQPNQPLDVYEKGRLVPIVERFPFLDFFNAADRFGWIEWGSLMGYGLGTEATVFDVNGTTTPALICYDSVFPGWVNEFVGNGAGFLTIITNDGWWGDSDGHTQHFAYARLRAIEHRQWVARSANNGISGIISPDGKIQAETEYWTQDAFSFQIHSTENRTFYGTYGDWLAWLLLLSSFFGIGYISLMSLKKAREKHSSKHPKPGS